MTRILVASDGSRAGNAAAAAAVKLVDERYQTMTEALQRAARIAREHGVDYELRLASDFDVDVLLETAVPIDADLVAAGSNRGGPVGIAFRRVSRALLERARRSVLVVDLARADAEQRWQAEISRGWQPSASPRRPSR